MISRENRQRLELITEYQRYGASLSGRVSGSKPNYPIRMHMPTIEIPKNATAEEVRAVLDETFEERMAYAFKHNLWI